MIPENIKTAVEKQIGKPISGFSPLSGGSINQVAKIICGDDSYVLKWNSAALSEMFSAEEKGLRLLRNHTDQLIIPEVNGHSRDETHSWLLISYVQETGGSTKQATDFGAALAGLHRNTNPEFGLDHDNFIGRLPQQNGFERDWIAFFREKRINPMIKMAVNSGRLPASAQQSSDRMFKRLPEIFPNEPASLLHGDLWSGNFITTNNDKTALIDPAVYFGHREAELAFTQLFGRFPTAFYDAYQSAWPLQPGFSERADFYNLYPVLVHVNLFGGGYCSQAMQILDRF